MPSWEVEGFFAEKLIDNLQLPQEFLKRTKCRPDYYIYAGTYTNPAFLPGIMILLCPSPVRKAGLRDSNFLEPAATRAGRPKPLPDFIAVLHCGTPGDNGLARHVRLAGPVCGK